MRFARTRMVCLRRNATLWVEIDITMWDFQVPVIAVFTKFDQFKRDTKMKLEDEGRDPEMDLNNEVENVFNQHYMANLNGPPPFIRLEGENHDVVNLINACCLMSFFQTCKGMANDVPVSLK